MTDSLFSRTIQVSIRSADGREKTFLHDELSGDRFNISFETQFGASVANSGEEREQQIPKYGQSKIKLWNVLQETVEMCQEIDGTKGEAELLVGYGGDLVSVSIGEITGYKTERSGADRYIEMAVSPAYTALRRRVDMTLRDTSVSDAINRLANNFGLQVSVDISSDPEIKNIKLFGSLRGELMDLIEKGNAAWTIRNGIFTVFDSDNPPDTGEPIHLDNTTGLIGRPEKKDKEITFRSLLRPQIVHGTSVTLGYIENGKSTSVSGTVQNGIHRGGSYGNEFITEASIKLQ